MSIIRATEEHLKIIEAVTRRTIEEIYPRYYPKGAVNHFLCHHHEDRIAKDLLSGNVFLSVNPEQQPVGAVTIQGNELCRLFVLPQFQQQGFGRELLDFAEARISEQFQTSILDASLPAKAIYFKRGYTVVETHAVLTESGDYLCYDVMQKRLLSFPFVVPESFVV